MQARCRCVLVRIWVGGEVGAVRPVWALQWGFADRYGAVLLLWVFCVFVLSCVCYVLCASVCVCFVVTCWERADLLAFVCGVYCEFVTFPLVSWVGCGVWLCRFLIFAPLLTLYLFYFLFYILICMYLEMIHRKVRDPSCEANIYVS